MMGSQEILAIKHTIFVATSTIDIFTQHQKRFHNMGFVDKCINMVSYCLDQAQIEGSHL